MSLQYLINTAVFYGVILRSHCKKKAAAPYFNLFETYKVAFPRLVYLKNMCHLWIFVTWWERCPCGATCPFLSEI